ncbi:hypothetical protein HDV00_002966 [Rhizophlyctis rosea]|nr:hypothetical protein HDV00_002966 [Rhizophlyctis rosea]
MKQDSDPPRPQQFALSLFYFVLIPNDGVLVHQSLIGKLIMKDTYPTTPPLIHLFTATGRYNVDVYRFRLNARDPAGSTSILPSKAEGGKWEEIYTLSCPLASLTQALVSTHVRVEYGGEKDVIRAC